VRVGVESSETADAQVVRAGFEDVVEDQGAQRRALLALAPLIALEPWWTIA
jgi:hypothetical protein